MITPLLVLLLGHRNSSDRRTISASTCTGSGSAVETGLLIQTSLGRAGGWGALSLARASSFEAQKYTGATNRIFNPFSSSRSSECSIAGRYHEFEKPRTFGSSGITSSVVVFCRQRQRGASSFVSS